ncbi:glycoside hydrolase family 43 protein [Gracilibacillus alcaliphilus]|uniref:glycoside hydrolase family 43 protein n=1 Tax=Gracilibacillus alcaliphilus TaxID=1401441 RepID=UPI0019562C2A|nr:glycoside hydrolase 43 family protein [Gracilibacillus alcaliphilus]MBM7677179.1 beta-xylosidase [Gracilibacillus alcaliphilus]
MIKLQSSTTEIFDQGNYHGNWGDLGDGTYNNPILPSDYSDPDIIRVGHDYFLITSTFQLSPGITVLYSNDLINWSIINHAVRDLTQIHARYNWDKMDGYSRGIWAPCITYNKKNQTYYIHFGTPDEGFFMVKTKDPFGQWSNIKKVEKIDGSNFQFGWDDCTVLWDDDGQGYFLGTNFSNNYQSWLFKLSDDGITLQDKGVMIHCTNDKYDVQEYFPEANKLFKRNGDYYFLHNGCYFVNKQPVRMAWMMKSSSIYGMHHNNSYGTYDNPGEYEHISYPIVEGYREPCQGNIVDAITEKGVKWYFFTHHGQNGPDGRPCSLLPIHWENGWPIVQSAKEKGRMIWNNLKKPFSKTLRKVPDRSDNFQSNKLSFQWLWNFQPRDSMWSLEERPGFIRLYAFKPFFKDKIETAGNTLLQRNYRYEKNTAIAKMDLSGLEDGQNTGMVQMAGSLYCGIGISKHIDSTYIKFFSNKKTYRICEINVKDNIILFKSDWNFQYLCNFSYSVDGVDFKELEEGIKLIGNDYMGSYIGFFNYNNKEEKGYVDIEYIAIESS